MRESERGRVRERGESERERVRESERGRVRERGESERELEREREERVRGRQSERGRERKRPVSLIKVSLFSFRCVVPQQFCDPP